MRLDFIFKKAKNVKAAQLIQSESGEVIIKIVPEVDFSDEDGAFIRSELENRVGKNNLDIIIELSSIDDLIYSRRRKFNYIVNRIKP